MINRRQAVLGGSAAVLASAAPAWAAAQGHFVGTLIFAPGDEARDMQVMQPFEYVDRAGRTWPVPAGVYVDGASIPPIFWPIIGGPFEGLYRAASVIHDWYCFVRARTWQDTDRMFYEAMLASKVSPATARVMFLAVWYGGPTWDELTRRNMAALTRDGTIAPPPPPSPPPPPPPEPPLSPPTTWPEPQRPTSLQLREADNATAVHHREWEVAQARYDQWIAQRAQRQAASDAQDAAYRAQEAEEARARQQREAAALDQFKALKAQVERDNLSLGQIEALVERTGQVDLSE